MQSDLYTFVEGVPARNAARSKSDDPIIELGPEFAKVDDFRSFFFFFFSLLMHKCVKLPLNV